MSRSTAGGSAWFSEHCVARAGGRAVIASASSKYTLRISDTVTGEAIGCYYVETASVLTA
jgi:hypothetical protein